MQSEPEAPQHVLRRPPPVRLGKTSKTNPTPGRHSLRVDRRCWSPHIAPRDEASRTFGRKGKNTYTSGIVRTLGGQRLAAVEDRGASIAQQLLAAERSLDGAALPTALSSRLRRWRA